MSISFTALPSKVIEPVYSPFYFVTNSSLNVSGNTNFKFVYKVQQLTPPALSVGSTLATVKLFARPTGDAVFSPSRILENTLTYDAENFYQTGINNSPNSIGYYKITFGEEFNTDSITYSSVTNNAGYAQFNMNGSPTLAVGDIITIKQTNPFYNSSYDGQQTITSISGATGFVTNKTFGFAASDSGSCLYRLVYYSANTFTGVTINFAKQYGERNKNFIQENVLGSSNSKFLMAYDGAITIQEEDVYVLSAFKSGNTNVGCVIITTGYDNITKGLYLLSGSTSAYNRIDVGVGAWNLARTNAFNGLTSITEPIFDSNVKSYSVIMCDSFIQGICKPVTFNVKKCNNDWNNIRLAFLNRRGAFGFVNWNMKTKRKLDLDRTIISKPLSWNYSIGDVQEFPINIEQIETNTLNTDWLTEEEGNYLEQLFTSPVVFWLVNGSQEYFPFVITSKEFEKKTVQNDSLIQYTIEGRFANPTNFQRN